MREFDLGRRFSLIFVARNSLLHLSEQDEFAAFFSSVRRHLKPDGVLAFDIFNPSLRLLSRPSGERFHVMRAIIAVAWRTDCRSDERLRSPFAGQSGDLVHFDGGTT